jgi:hypothetical protein
MITCVSDLACQVNPGAGSDTGPGRESWRLQSFTARGPRIVEDMSDMDDDRRVSTAPVAVAMTYSGVIGSGGVGVVVVEIRYFSELFGTPLIGAP